MYHSFWYKNEITFQLYRLSVSSAGGIKLLLKETERDNLTKEESLLVCGILCTADYCLETAQQVGQDGMYISPIVARVVINFRQFFQRVCLTGDDRSSDEHLYCIYSNNRLQSGC